MPISDGTVTATPGSPATTAGCAGRRTAILVDAGYLYLVLHTQQLPEGRWDVLRSSFARPALGAVLAVVALTTLLAALIIAAVTKPLRRLTEAVATLLKSLPARRFCRVCVTSEPTAPV